MDPERFEIVIVSLKIIIDMLPNILDNLTVVKSRLFVLIYLKLWAQHF